MSQRSEKRRQSAFLMVLGGLLIVGPGLMLMADGPDHVVGNRLPHGVWVPIAMVIGALNLILGIVYLVRSGRA